MLIKRFNKKFFICDSLFIDWQMQYVHEDESLNLAQALSSIIVKTNL